MTTEQLLQMMAEDRRRSDEDRRRSDERFELLLGRVVSHEQEAKEEFKAVNLRLDEIKEKVKVSETLKEVLEEKISKQGEHFEELVL